MIYFKLFLTAVFWGGTFIAGRILAQEVDPYSGSFLRFFVASVCMIPLVWHFEGRLQPLRRKSLFLVFLSGMTGVSLYNICFLSGLQTVPASRASVSMWMSSSARLKVNWPTSMPCTSVSVPA